MLAAYHYFFHCVFLVIGLTVVSFNPAVSVGNTSNRRFCSPNQLACRNGQCISKVTVCDGRKDCSDGSDENHVTCANFLKCPKNTFRCAYGACVDADSQCNGVADCADNSDELILSCPTFNWLQESAKNCSREKFQCHSGECVDRFLLCDGKSDCTDGSDETVTQCNQEFFKCLPSSFRCAYGACVANSMKCDGKNDCVDGSDEDDFLCNSIFTIGEGYQVITSTTTSTTTTTPKPNVAISPGKCVIPDSYGTTFFSASCMGKNNCQAILPKSEWDHDRYVIINCNEGYFHSKNISVCLNGQWNPKDNTCIPLCEPVNTPSGTRVKCTYNGRIVNCTDYTHPGTTTKLSCQLEYTIEGAVPYYENTCQENGKWLRPFSSQRCLHECGILLEGKELIAGGKQANISRHPWNVALYFLYKGNYILICGGTLITPVAVLTAAHCMYSADRRDFRKASNFRIGLGKEYRAIDDPRDEGSAQIIEVKTMYAPQHYDGSVLSGLSDVAILELKKAAKINEYAMPACIDFNFEFTLNSTMYGTFAGWGFDSTGVPSPTLKEVVFPYVSYPKCLQVLRKIRRDDELTKDKFCAFYIDKSNTTKVQPGDGGSGLIFKFKDKHYVFGLASTSIDDYVSTFTDIRHELNFPFIKEIFLKITSQPNS